MSTILKSSMVKIIIGMIVGCVATWFFLESKTQEAQGLSGQVSEVELSRDFGNNTANGKKSPEVSEQTSADMTTQELQEEVALLRQQLGQTQQQLRTAEATKDAAIEKLKNNLATNVSYDSEQTNKNDGDGKSSESDDYLREVPQKYHGLLQRPSAKTPFDRHQDFFDETEDVAWSLEKEQQITSYIQGHARGGEITLDLVKCKKTICEVYGSTFSQNGEAVSIISDGMRSQPWWDFVGTSSSSRSGENMQSLFLIILHGKF